MYLDRTTSLEASIVRWGFDEKKEFFSYLKVMLKRDEKYLPYVNANLTNGDTLEEVKIFERTLEMVLNLVKKSITSSKSDFADMLEENNLLNSKSSVMNNFYGCLVFRLIRLKIADYQNLLKENEAKTIQQCRNFLIKHFTQVIRDNFIFNEINSSDEFSSALTSLKDFVDAVPEDNDAALRKEEIVQFNHQIVREH